MADIKKELNDIKNAVYGREVRSSIHDGIKKINDEAENAIDLSESAKHQVENIQQQVNQLVVEGDSSVEAAQARVDAEGKSYPTLKARLDTEHNQLSSQLAQTKEDLIQRSINVKTFGAVGDGESHPLSDYFSTLEEAQQVYPHATSLDDEIDWAAIQGAINSVKHEPYEKGGQSVTIPVPDKFYRINKPLNLDEIWNVTIECPATYGWQRHAQSPQANDDLKLIHWFGNQGEDMISFGNYSFGIEFRNITLNGRNIAKRGFSVDGYVNRDIKFYSCQALYFDDCGVVIGDVDKQTDNGAITFYSCRFMYNKNTGLKVASGNAYVYLYGTSSSLNGKNPSAENVGSNIHLVAGELFVSSYTSDGEPKDGDIFQESGGLRIHGAWSDITYGLFLNTRDATSSVVLSGVRHYDHAMNDQNTPLSIRYEGRQPLVLESCLLYGSVEVSSGKQSHVVDLGTRFISPNATFVGDMVDDYYGYIGIGTAGQNEARLTVGKPPRKDVGDYHPFTQWGRNNRPLGVKTTDNYTVTDNIIDGLGAYEMLGNAYNDGGNYRSIKEGPVWRVTISKTHGIRFQTSDNATGPGQTITWQTISQ